MSRWWRSAWAGAWTPPTPGTAAWPSSRTWRLDHMDRLGTTVAAIAREKAAIIERGDLAVTGAAGEALAIVRRRCTRLGVPLAVASPAPVLGWTRDALHGGPAAPRSHVRRAAGPSPGGQRRDGGCPARRARGRWDRDGPSDGAPGRATRRHDGPGAWSCSRSPCRDGASVRSSSTEPTTRTAPPPSPSPWTTCGRTSPAAGDAAGPAHPRLGVHGGQGRRRRDRRRSSGPRPLSGATVVCTARGPAAGDAPGGAGGRLAGAPPRGDGADAPRIRRPRWTSRSGRSRGPVVVAGSLYLVGAVRARLVDDPALRDPGPGMSHRRLPDERGVVRERPDQGGGAATPSYGLPDGAGAGLPGTPWALAIGPATFAWGERTFVMGDRST